jgi:hypothetical protein
MEMETSRGNSLRIFTCNTSVGRKVSEMQLPVGRPDGEAPRPARLLL